MVTGLLRFALPIVALLTAISATAGVRFDFLAEAPGYTYAGRMSLHGKRSRMDIASGNHPLFNGNITLITREAGDDITVVDHSRRTFFQRRPPPSMRGPLATAAGIGGRSTASQSRVSKTRERLEAEGGPAERHTVRAAYRIDMDVEGEKLKATVQLHAEFDIDPAIEQLAFPTGLQYGARTGFEKLDWAIARRIPDRLPLRQFVSASRQIEGGPLLTETFTFTVTNVSVEEVDDREFYAPAGYRYEEPVFSFGQ